MTYIFRDVISLHLHESVGLPAALVWALFQLLVCLVPHSGNKSWGQGCVVGSWWQQVGNHMRYLHLQKGNKKKI